MSAELIREYQHRDIDQRKTIEVLDKALKLADLHYSTDTMADRGFLYKMCKYQSYRISCYPVRG